MTIDRMRVSGETADGVTRMTPRLVLRTTSRAAADAVHEFDLATHAHRQPWESRHGPSYFSLHACREGQARWERAYRDGTGAFFLVFLRDEPQRVIATIGLHDIKRPPMLSTYVGYSLRAELEGNGYIHEALGAVLDYAFHERKLHRVEAFYAAHNRRSANVLRRAGFVIEGRARKHLAIDGEWHDSILTAKVNDAITAPV
jgi:ribosomal-protein-alanine N-acetyltransferase